MTSERQTPVYQTPEPQPIRESAPNRTPTPAHPDPNSLLFRSADVDLYADRLDAAWAVCTRRRLTLVAVCVALGLVWAAFRIINAPILYEAHGEIKLKQAEIHLGRSLPPRLAKHAVADEAAFLTSDSSLRRIALRLDLTHNDAFLSRTPRRDGKTRPPAPMDQVITRLYYGLSVSFIDKSPLLYLSFISRDPLLSQSIVNTAIDISTEHGSDTDLARVGITTAFFAGRITELKRQIEQEQDTEDVAEQKLGVGALMLQNRRTATPRNPFDTPNRRSPTFGLPTQTSVFSIDAAINQRDLPLDILSRAARQAKLARQLAEARQALLEKLGPQEATGDLAGSLTRPTQPLLQLRQDIATAQVQYAGLATVAGPNNPQQLALRAQIDATSQILASLQRQQLRREAGQVQLARARDLDLSTAVRDRLAEANRIRIAEIDTSMLRLDLALDRSIFDDLRGRLVSAQLDASIGSTDVNIIDKAFFPNAPIPRDYRGPILLGIGLGLLAGALLWAVFYLRDSKLLAIPDLENTADLPVLGALPFTEPAQRPSPGQPSRPQAPNPELCAALYSLRDDLIRIAPQGGARRILFTSSLPGEGKTTTATNFAIALARGASGVAALRHTHPGLTPSVLLIDTDMHRPAVHDRFHLNSRSGLSSVLAGELPLAEAVQTISNEPRLHVLTAGPIPPRPSELLLSAPWAALLKEASEAYDFVVLDTPPMLATSDALILGAQIEAMFLVARYGRINGRLLRRSRQLWTRAGVQPAGAILNGIPQDPH